MAYLGFLYYIYIILGHIVIYSFKLDDRLCISIYFDYIFFLL